MIVGSRYVPERHIGTRDDIVMGLLNEYASIDASGMMRGHAKDREKQRIIDQLASLKVELWIGSGPDEGYILGHEGQHEPSCTDDVCNCLTYAFRVPR